jgi:hypothetical protein
MTRLFFAFLIVLSAAAAQAADGDIVKSNESIRVDSGKTAGDVRTTNDSVNIASGAKVQTVSNTNGEIELADNAEARELRTTNGNITIGAHGRVTGGVTTTNGSVRLGQGAEIGGKVTAINGSADLDGAHVAGGIETRQGAVTIGHGSKVEGGVKTIDGAITIGAGVTVTGGLLIEPADNSRCTHDCNDTGTTTFSGLMAAIFGSKQSDTAKPQVVIGPGAVVQGKLDFRRDVDLEVSDRAKIGAVNGATAKMFAGEKP